MNIETNRATTVFPELLDAGIAVRARAAIGDIARALQNPPVAWIPGPNTEPFRQARGASLVQGRAGLALFYAYLHRSSLKVPGVDAVGAKKRYLDEAFGVLARVPMPLGLMRGCAGVLWVARHVHDLLSEDEPGPLELAGEYLGYPVAKDGFDLWQGLVGHGVYALEGLPDPRAARLVANLVARLDEAAVNDDEGARWLTRPETLHAAARRRHSRPYINLGAAHGQAGVIAFLARAHAAGIEAERSFRLATNAVRWLEARAASGAGGRYLPTLLDEGGAPVMGMETWCNGTPGAAAALLVAAECCDEPSWRDLALDLARDAALRARNLESRPDASLCHGAAGEALLWHGFHRATGEELFADAARTWYRRTLAMGHSATGVGGYVAMGFDNLGEVVETHDPGLLQGAAGVGLALLVGLGVIERSWCRLLLMPGDLHHEHHRQQKERA